MGCSASRENLTQDDKKLQNKESAGNTGAGHGSVVETVPVVVGKDNASLNNSNHIDKATKKDDSNINSQQESLEVLVTRKDKPRTTSKKNGTKARRKSKELKQITAWGKKGSTSENNFLEDLRLLRNATCSAQQYEKEYDAIDADDTSRFIKGREKEDSTESSLSDILDNHSEHHIGPSQRIVQEESFDVSKIIDVEKFRAANVTEKKEGLNNNTNKENYENGDTINLKTDLHQERQHSNSSCHGKSVKTKQQSFTGLYNEDDKHLIESIEKEFLITHENFLPGQIIN